MATKVEENVIAPEEKVYDPWTDMCTVFLPKGNPGEADFQYVGVNGRMFQVPRGRQVQVPRPVFDVLAYSDAAKDYTDRFDKVNENVEREGL